MRTIIRQFKRKIKDYVKHCDAETQVGFYQRLHDGQKMAALRTLFRPHRSEERELFVNYDNRIIIKPKELLSYISQYDIVSFDIFDTLLFRTVGKPEDVFALVEQQTVIAGFARERVRAEYSAREKVRKRTNTTEVALDDIYAELISLYGEQCDPLKKQEIQTELSCCYANPFMLDLLNELHRQGKKVIAVSDMYLPRTIIEEMLHKCGFTQLSDIYVSCEHGVGKADGRLFQIVRDRYPNSSIVHVGDNYRSDAIGGKQCKVQGIHYIKSRINKMKRKRAT